jgi:hypothetical protein
MDNYIVSGKKIQTLNVSEVLLVSNLSPRPLKMQFTATIGTCLLVLRASWSREDILCPYFAKTYQLYESYFVREKHVTNGIL